MSSKGGQRKGEQCFQSCPLDLTSWELFGLKHRLERHNTTKATPLAGRALCWQLCKQCSNDSLVAQLAVPAGAAECAF